MHLSQLLADVEIKSEYKDVKIGSVTSSTDNITDGCVFVAVKGLHFDGHDFVKDALKNGAAAVVVGKNMGLENCIEVEDTRKAYALMCRNFFSRPDEKLKLIGITGTNGKSTTSAILQNAFESMDIRYGAIGTLGNKVGDTVYPTTYTTPDAGEIYRLLSLMVENGAEYVVVEATSQALDQLRLYGVKFDVGAFTNLSQDHLDYHKSIENYRECKKELFFNSKVGVFNADDEASEYMADGVSCQKVTYGLKDGADYRAYNVELLPDGVTYTVNGSVVNFGTAGQFSVYNSLCAVAILGALGFDFDVVCTAVSGAPSLKGRLEILQTKTPYRIVVDYAHTPDGFEKLLETVKGFTDKKVIVVFGCGGDRDQTKRPKMGRIAADNSDIAIVTTDNPRAEEPTAIIKDILIGMVGSHAKVITFIDRKEAIENALSLAKEGDTVVLAGKGHETYQIIGTKRVHFDEHEIVRDILERGQNGKA